MDLQVLQGAGLAVLDADHAVANPVTSPLGERALMVGDGVQGFTLLGIARLVTL
jgi:hypothetical protein